MSCLSASSVHAGPLATSGTSAAAEGPPVVSVGLDPDHAEGRGAPEAPGSGNGNFNSAQLDGPGRRGRGRHAREAGLKQAVAGIQVWAAGCGLDNAMEVVKATLRCEPRSDKIPRGPPPSPSVPGEGLCISVGPCRPTPCWAGGSEDGRRAAPSRCDSRQPECGLLARKPRWAGRPFPGIGAGLWFPGQRAQRLTRLLPPACSWVLIALWCKLGGCWYHLRASAHPAPRPPARGLWSLWSPWPHLVGGPHPHGAGGVGWGLPPRGPSLSPGQPVLVLAVVTGPRQRAGV